MKYQRPALAVLAAVIVLAAVLVWFLPARLAMPWLRPRLHGLQLEHVQGLVWEGHADAVRAADGRLLGRVDWQIPRRAMFGSGAAQLAVNGPGLTFSGAVQSLPGGRVQWQALSLQADWRTLAPALVTPIGQPLGELRLDVTQALLQGGWPLSLQARGRWSHAALRTRTGVVLLGDLRAELTAQDGVVRMRLWDDGNGPLQIAADGTFSPLGWRMDATLHPRQTDAASRMWLTGLGRPDATGIIHLHRSGGLLGSRFSATSQDPTSP